LKQIRGDLLFQEVRMRKLSGAAVAMIVGVASYFTLF
jgi:hypothetical protein